jgi:hypothetical protein
MSRQNPFSLYDFLGYFLPGALFFYGLIFAVFLKTPSKQVGDVISSYLKFDRPEMYVIFIIASYVAGHILSFVSSLTIERYSVWRHGYPSKYLLRLEVPPYFRLGVFRKRRLLLRILVPILIAPVVVLDFVVGELLGLNRLYIRPLDEALATLIDKKVKRLALVRSELPREMITQPSPETDFFRFVYHYTVENAPNHLPKMQNYVALYGFLRTISVLGVAFFWVSVVALVTHRLPQPIAIASAIGTAILAYLAYADFVKFYRRFSLEALMALSVVLPMP